MSLAEGTPDLPYPKLPFWDTVSLAYSTYFRHFIDALRASWLWLIAAAALTAFASWQQWSWMATAMANLKPGLPPQMPKPTEMAVLLSLDNIVLLLAGVSIAVAWHRRLILGEHPGISGANVGTRSLWRYIGVGLAICLLVILPAAVIVAPMVYFLLPFKAGGGPTLPGFFLLILVFLLLYIVGAAIVLRLSLLLPARAVDDLSLTFKQTWNRTHGNTWRIFWGLVACIAPPSLVVQIAILAGIGLPNPSTFASEAFAERMTIFSTIFIVYYLLVLPIVIGFLSHAYRHFFQADMEAAR
jgi:hypothetical protein